MESLSGLLAFVRTAELRSFVAAGDKLGLSASAVGKSVARLEERLGVRLLQRSTRRISLTEEGALFFERCQRIVAEIHEAESELQRLSDAPRGRLRISLPAATHRLLMPVLAQFAQRYPDIQLELDFNDRMVDVIAEGLDAAIRSGELADSGLTARPLCSYRFMLIAAPAYLAQRGQPTHPQQLEQHACLRYRFPAGNQLQPWPLMLPPNSAAVTLVSALVCNSVEALLGAAVRGLGIACLPDFAVQQALASGELQQVLADCTDGGGSFSLLWPTQRQLLPNLRVFVDFLITQCAVRTT